MGTLSVSVRRRLPLRLPLLLLALLLVSSISEIRAQGAMATSCVALATSSVESVDDAAQLRLDLLRCSGNSFEVEWRGSIRLDQPMKLMNGTSLRITGIGKNSSAIDGNRAVQLFVVTGSGLHLESLALTGGEGVNGGVVAARDGSSIKLVDCDVYNNTANSGGAIFLDDSTFVASSVNFTGNSADVFGGALHAQHNSTISTEDGTDNTFHGNSAKFGGAISMTKNVRVVFGSGEASLTENYANFEGAAIRATDYCDITTDGTTRFEANRADNNGGAVFAKNESTVHIAGNTSFIDNVSRNYGGAIMVTEDGSIRTRGETRFVGNLAKTDGGAIQAQYTCTVTLAGRTTFVDNWASVYGGAINAFDAVTLKTVGSTTFSGNTAEYGGGIYADRDAVLELGGRHLFYNNTARSEGGALCLVQATVTISGRPEYRSNTAISGSGGALYGASISAMEVKNARYIENSAMWGGAVALFSSGSQMSTSTASSEFSTRTTGYDPKDLTPSLGISGSSDPSSGSDSGSGSTGSSWVGETPVRFSDCAFKDNNALEDGGGIYTVAGFDVIRNSSFINNRAGSAGGAVVHAGVMVSMSDSVFEDNLAGSEGPAVLSLGLLKNLVGVSFSGNGFYCAAGLYSTEAPVTETGCRFAQVCSRCATDCDSGLVDGATVMQETLVPYCEATPEGSVTKSGGGTVTTLEIEPGWFRSSLASTDIRECFRNDACRGGMTLGEYCAPGYDGPYCAVCKVGYAPGYAHACKSCFGDNKDRAVGITTAMLCLVFIAITWLVLRLVSVVETAPSSSRKILTPWQKKCEVWQQRVKQTFPLTAIKIVVVVWQIVTQYSDLSGVQFPGAYNEFLAVIDLVNLDLGFILSLACIYDTNFYDRLLMATLGPVVVLLVLGCTYLVARRRNRGSDEAVAIVQRRHLSVALFAIFLVYATVSHTIFETFVCDSLDDGESYLRADYSVMCTTERHTGFRVYAAIMVIVYPIGFPFAFGWWLFKYRHELKRDDRVYQPELRPLADLWEPYKPDKYYYEVVECFRRIALTGLAVFIHTDSSAQIAIVLLLAAIFMVASEILSPFDRPLEMWLYRAGHYVVFASMYLALLLRVDVSDERTQSQEVFSGVIVIAHAAMLLVVVAQGLLLFIGWEDLVEAPEALKGLDRTSHEPEIEAEDKPSCHACGAPVCGPKISTGWPPCRDGNNGLTAGGSAAPTGEKGALATRKDRWEAAGWVGPVGKKSFYPSPAPSVRGPCDPTIDETRPAAADPPEIGLSSSWPASILPMPKESQGEGGSTSARAGVWSLGRKRWFSGGIVGVGPAQAKMESSTSPSRGMHIAATGDERNEGMEEKLVTAAGPARGGASRNARRGLINVSQGRTTPGRRGLRPTRIYGDNLFAPYSTAPVTNSPLSADRARVNPLRPQKNQRMTAEPKRYSAADTVAMFRSVPSSSRLLGGGSAVQDTIGRRMSSPPGARAEPGNHIGANPRTATDPMVPMRVMSGDRQLGAGTTHRKVWTPAARSASTGDHSAVTAAAERMPPRRRSTALRNATYTSSTVNTLEHSSRRARAKVSTSVARSASAGDDPVSNAVAATRGATLSWESLGRYSEA